MLEITPENALAYLVDRGLVPAGRTADVQLLAWGVSNVVLRVEPQGLPPFVLKQSRERLRTPDPWFSRLDRIYREIDVMRVLEPLLPRGVVPRVLFEDRENYLFAMEAAPADHVVWKQQLLSGVVEPRVARFLGECLATIHTRTAGRPELRERFGDTEVFCQLRIDPFYRRVAATCPEVSPQIERMIESALNRPLCLVHADYSPKNVLIAGAEIVLVDYETGHYGDPAFDLGFFLSHLLLKSILYRRRFADYAGLTTAFWAGYRESTNAHSDQPPIAPGDLVTRTNPHLAGCLWARVDGTSQVDYLRDPEDRQIVREFSRSLFLEPPADWAALLDRLQRRLVA